MILFLAGLLTALIPCALLLKQAHRESVTQAGFLDVGERQFRWLIAHNETLASVVCGLTWQVGALEAYLERIERNYTDVAARAPIGSAIRVQAIIRSHSADNTLFVLHRLFDGP